MLRFLREVTHGLRMPVPLETFPEQGRNPSRSEPPKIMCAMPMTQLQDSPKVLVVDDNSDNRALARAALEDEGYQVLLASTGEEALQAFETLKPDCVLLDIRMPGMSGLEVCQCIRRMPAGADTPIVFLTALRDVETFDQALAAGGDDFLTKPVRPAELVVRVQSVLKLRRMGSELREQYDLVRHQRDDLMRLQLQKERLTSFVVHDLKNPVSAMDLHAQLLLRDPEVPARARESVQQIRAEARGLLRLVLNLLDISKSEEGHLTPKLGPVDLLTLSAEVIEAMEIKAQGSQVKLLREMAVPEVHADGDLLRRVLENLLENAIRHAPERSVVKLSSSRSGLGRATEIRVADAGEGVPPEMREKIFERFAQVEQGTEPTRNRTGRGLGLTFCKLAVESHRGTIHVEDGSPGATFVVRLPDAD